MPGASFEPARPYVDAEFELSVGACVTTHQDRMTLPTSAATFWSAAAEAPLRLTATVGRPSASLRVSAVERGFGGPTSSSRESTASSPDSALLASMRAPRGARSSLALSSRAAAAVGRCKGRRRLVARARAAGRAHPRSLAGRLPHPAHAAAQLYIAGSLAHEMTGNGPEPSIRCIVNVDPPNRS